MSLLLSLMLAAAPAGATKPDDLAVEAMHNFGKCVAEMTPAGAREVLAMDYRTDEYRERMRRLAKGHDRCTRPGTELRFDGVLLAGAMAEALIEENPAKLAAADKMEIKMAARSEVEGMALCTVMTSQPGVLALLKTDVASDAEASAARELEPVLHACIADGTKATMNRPALRSVLALAAWRLASAAGNNSGGAQ